MTSSYDCGVDEAATLTKIPEVDEAAELLSRLGVPAVEMRLILAQRPPDEESTDIVDAYARALTADMGGFGELPTWPSRDDFLYAWVFLAALPAVRGYHATREIPDEVAWATLADLGRTISETRWRTGRPGFGDVWWLTLHFRGSLYRLGRLQFAREPNGLGVHIPRDGGPLTPESCDSSFALARAFFARHFTDAPADVARCTSWLLDPQLASYLGQDSNIVRFARRFELTDGVFAGDDDIIRFVFGELRGPIESLPQKTTLQRAVVAHLRAGQHWHVRRGVLPLSPRARGGAALPAR
jgi:hypothetical protein